MRPFLFVVLSISVHAAEYGFTDYHFIDPDRPVHLDTRYRAVGRAKFEDGHWGHVEYADADLGLYYSQFLDEENSLTWELGYDFLRFDWHKNPRFSDRNFHYLIGSLGYVSTALDRWRWIVNVGFSVDAVHLDMSQSGVGQGMLWGRYNFGSNAGVHVGVLGWYGVLNGHAWPIFGFDWKFDEAWSANAIFPCDYSLNYAFNENWALEAAYANFGGPYRYPRRAHDGKNGHHDPIFMIYSNGVDLSLKYKFEHILRASVGAGWNFGGWIQIRDQNNRHGKYYHYESAPYAQASVELTF